MKRLLVIIALVLGLALPPQVELPGADGAGCALTLQAKSKNKTKKQKQLKRKAQRKRARQAAAQHRRGGASVSTPVPLVGRPAVAAAPGVADRLLLVGLPTAMANRTLVHQSITIFFNPRWRIPNCVAYELTGTMVAMTDAPGAERRKNYRFAADPAAAGSPGGGDYRGSGYTRGHMAPAMDMRFDRQAMTECFYMTNMCPQDEKLNNGAWRQLEERVHRWAKRDGRLVIFTGPVMPAGQPAAIGPKSDIAVPAAFYKIVYAPGQGRAIAFVYDNKPPVGGLERHATTITDVECRTGLTFLGGLAAQQQRALKQQCDLSQWK